MRLTTVHYVVVVLFVCAVGVTMSLQGWRSDVPGDDLNPYIDAAHALVANAQLPDRGHPTSYHSYSTPGPAWMMLPGMWLVSDVRLIDVPGNAILHLGTLIGIFLLTRLCFGDRCALIAVLLYGLSDQGLAFAHTYAPKGRHEFFYVWMVYWTCRWVMHRRSRYLGAALVTWLAGMYMFMEIAPAVFVLPAVWLVYKPTVRARTLVAACAIGIVMWYPYLRFEAGRRFADIRSQVLLEYLDSGDAPPGFCAPAAILRQLVSSAPGVSPQVAAAEAEDGTGGVLAMVRRRFNAVVHGLRMTFEGFVPRVNLVLLAFAMAGLLLAAIGRESSRVFAIGLVVPWSLLLVIVEYGRSDRFVGLWPLQMIALASFADLFPEMLGSRAGRIARWAVPAATVGLLLTNFFPLSRVRAWQQDGWAGRDAAEVRVADYLALQLHSDNKRSAAIGRQLLLEGRPTPPWRAVDARWRAGEAVDLMLEYRHGLANLDQCGEGVSADDEYRVVEVVPSTPNARYFFDIPPAGRLRWLTQIGPYQIYKRD